MSMGRNCISIPVEVFGGTIRAAARQAIELSNRLDCPVHFDFNKVHMQVNPTSSVERLVEDYDNRFGACHEDDERDEAVADLLTQRNMLKDALAELLRVTETEDAEDDEIDAALNAGRRAIVRCVMADMKGS